MGGGWGASIFLKKSQQLSYYEYDWHSASKTTMNLKLSLSGNYSKNMIGSDLIALRG